MTKRLLKLALAASFILAVTALFTVTASAATYGDLTYTVSNGKVTITGCSTSATSVTIPSTINGNPVTSIGYEAFYNCTSLTSVDIPEGVTRIGNYAFSGCTSLTSIYYNAANVSGLSDSNYVFAYAGQSGEGINLTIGKDVEHIPAYLFSPRNNSSYSPKITEVAFEEGSVCKSIGGSAFAYCTSLTSISIPDSVTSIGDSAFCGCTSLTSISIPDSVTSIGDSAFYNCTSLTSVYYNAANVSDLSSSNRVFYNAGQSGEGINLTIGKDVEHIPAYLFCPYSNSNTHKITEVVFEEGGVCKSIGNYAFGYCKSLTSINIPEGVTSIGNYAFYWCTSLTSITIPEGVTSIGEYAFYWCTSLKSVNIPDSVTSIGNYAFYYCTRLTRIKIPDSVTIIGDWAFYNCTSLTSISIGNSVTGIGEDAFLGCTKLSTVYYCGTDEEWNNISIGSYDTYLTGATRYYHKYVVTVVNEPTCTENGTKITKCDICGIESTEIIPALGHRVVEGEDVFVDPITTKNDSTYPFSYVDGVYSSTNKAHSTSSTFTITALYDCTVKLEYSVSSEQNYDKLIIKKNGIALCTVSGVVSWTAVDVSLKAGDKLTISYSKDSGESNNSDTGYFKLLCDKIQIIDKPADECEPTCTDAVVCSYCNEVAKDALGHEEITHSAKAPTCTDVGWNAYVACSRCDKTTYAELPALGHDETTHSAKAPTCTDIGWDAYVTCSRCEYSTYAELPALGHDETTYSAKAPTCTEIGWDAYVTCTRCDFNTCVEKPALGHDEITHDAKAPTCTAIGWESYVTCSRCDYTTYNELSALGHSWSDWTTIVANSCTKAGLERRTCSVCKATENNRIAPAHKWGEWYTVIAPTCTDNGTEQRLCSVCSATEEASIPMLHDEIAHSAKAPTCTEFGWDAYVTCSRCEYSTYTELPALGHDYSEWEILLEPDEYGEGFKSKVCGNCGDEVFEMILYASGDVDGDGELTNSDITLAIRAMSGWTCDGEVMRVDTNYDGKINNRDIIAIIQKLAGWN